MRVASEQPKEITSLSAHGIVSARSCYSGQNSVGVGGGGEVRKFSGFANPFVHNPFRNFHGSS